MKAFAQLLDKLYFTASNNAKATIVKNYLAYTPDPDRGWAIAAIAGTLQFDLFKRKLIKDLISERVDPYLFELSYDYVGELSETIAHLWPASNQKNNTSLPSLSEVVNTFAHVKKEDVSDYLVTLLNCMTAQERWALVKLGTRGLRIGISSRFLKKILAEYGNKDVSDIETLWHGLEPPYTELLHWLEDRAERPSFDDKLIFNPMMLAHPLADDELEKIHPENWLAEWKYDGIRVQLVSKNGESALFSRTGDNISDGFPDITVDCHFDALLDGELLVKRSDSIASFNELQQRLNKKKPSKKLINDYPAHIIVYDVLGINQQDCTNMPLLERRKVLENFFCVINDKRLSLSENLAFNTPKDLAELRSQAEQRTTNDPIEGLMLKHKQSLYVAGRPKGQWVKWKRDPLNIDAVMMYAQRGHGKRSSFYSDYTFGLWRDDVLLPIGKAYSGFTDEELKKLDRWVRGNTTGRFGPVREVDKALVLEVAFDSVHYSKRHKSGVALRFPRIHRIRWDKPAGEADKLSTLEAFCTGQSQRP